ncbi:hypothetical protein ACROYT_G025008 [Oculina patagonica]
MAAAPDPDEVLRSTSGKANFQRVARLLISGGTTLLREVFDQLCPPSNLPTILIHPVTEKQLKAAKLTKPQWDCLYLSPGVYGESADFDVTLLFKLLRTICNLIPPAMGWDALPTNTDHGLAADLARIKYYRNSVYGHVKQNMEIPDDEFLSLWQEISNALIRIAGQISHEKKREWQKAIDSFLKDSLTAEDERNVNELLEWYENDRDVKKCIEELKSSTKEEIERLETSVQCGFKGSTQLLETAVREEAQCIKDQLREEIKSSTNEVQKGVERLETSVQERLEGTTNVLETAIRKETQTLKDQLGKVNQSIDRLSTIAGGPQGAKVQLRVRIDCETIPEPGPEVGASKMVVSSQEPQAAGVQGMAVVPIASGGLEAEATGGLGLAGTGDDGIPSSQGVLNFIAYKSFKSVDPSKPEELNGFLQYLEKVKKVLILDVNSGSLIMTVECSSLKILEGLWEDYCTGYVNKMAQKYLVTEDVLREFGLLKVKLRTTILEEEYIACRDYFLQSLAVDDDDGFDLIQPSLIQQLRTILDQYPDDGQILKELIQNAEDARASQVKFLHDKHSYGTEKLHCEGLAQFQGPALYAYNDAQFTKEDWKGIRMLCDSIKVKDPMKVGRFGLGFKSVFHLTDLPSIVSSSQIGVIDPHEEYFGDGKERRTGHRWRMKEDRAVMDSIPDQFLPYKGIFDCTDDVFSDGIYSGTLFRFPLRSTPSKLSQTLYSAEKVHTLFESFMADAHLILLFLQYLESIELYVREESDTEARKKFQVRISDDSLQVVREKRREFRSEITTGQLMPQPVKVTYPITIETQGFSEGKESGTQRHSFLVTNYFCGGKVSSEFERLATDEELNYLPLVGVAMALPESSESHTPDIRGHVFCFLPLPVQKTSLTGLPVHVNGFFALNQNRRYIKTPNAEQEDLVEKEGRQLTDKSLLWNQCLLKEAIPRAYATMLMGAINERSYSVQAEAIYKAWPDMKGIDQKWKRLQDPLFKLLCAERVVYTPAHGGNWLNVEDVIFDRLQDNDPKELLAHVFLAAGQNVANLPDHVLKALELYTSLDTEITPSLARKVLKATPSCYRDLSRSEKLLLLKFVLKDENVSELLGLELLPVSNGLFTSFSNSGEAIYISSPQHPRELLPCLQDRFLDRDIDEKLLRSLQAVAEQGCTQLRHLCKDNVATLLSKSLPPEWSVGEIVQWYPGVENHPPKEWLGIVWDYIGKNFSTVDELHRLQNLPLLPVDMSQVPVTLARLTQPSKIVLSSLHGDHLADNLAEVLEELGVTVIQELPNFVSFHPAVSKTFAHPPSAQGVLRALAASLPEMTTKIQKVTDGGKRSLRKFVANVSSLEPEAKQVLGSLPLFETLSKAFVSKKEGLCAAPEESFPVTPRRDLIDIKDDDSKKLAALLGIKILTPVEFILEEVFPGVEEGRYTVDEIDSLMAFVMRHYNIYADADWRFKQKLKDLPFLSTESRRVTPMEIFDPRKDLLRRIFSDEDVFPAEEQYTDPKALLILEELGMKGEKDITGKDLYQSARAVSNISSLSTAEMKSKALMEYLTNNPLKLQESTCGTSLGLLLQDISWVSRIKRKPSDFPQSLSFWGETCREPNFHKPSEVMSEQLANLIGSVKPVVKTELSSQLADFFSWNTKPTVLDVAEQLKNVISCYVPDEKPRYILIVKEIYAFLSSENHEDVKAALNVIDNPAWIWNGDGFSSPNVLLSEKPPIDLSPYICSLPSEVLHYSAFFSSFGLLEQCNDAFMLQVLHLIKQKYDSGSNFPTSEVKKDLQLSVDILTEVKPKVGEQLPSALQEKVLIPTKVEGDVYLKLAPVEDCMYSEHEGWGKENQEEGMDYLLVHPNIPNSTAELLLVPTPVNRMLEPDELEIGVEFGQEEKLTRRLSRLLEYYTDGFAVPKELVQNADDAGASEIRFLYDERTNEDAMTCLIDEEMRHCQGPALWVYNDAEFRDEDFANITKLNGATKESDTEKIGKFGLGFNSVYNLTDVPMFVSRNYFVIFDPNTFYLGKAIRNKNKPGMKIDINKNTKRLRKFSNQFKPFNGIFDCDLRLDKEDNSFDGTLFRFPLRTIEQAIKSEIKQLHYDSKQVEELFKIFSRGAKTLLLFTQNVRRISVFHLPRDSASSQQPILLFEVSKSLYQGGILRELTVPVTLSPAVKNLSTEDQYFLKQCNVLRASSEVAKHIEDSTSSSTALLSSALTVSIKSTITQCGRSFLKDDGNLQDESEIWLVASSMGKGKALQFAQDDKSLLPSAGVAAQLLPDESKKLLPVPVVDQMKTKEPPHKGTLFCYLPLPIYSGFPVHLNGAFAVAASRRGLKKKTADDKDCFGVKWNNILMQDSICAAYLDLLEDVKKSAANSYQFHSLWPKACEVQLTCVPLARAFYQNLASGGYSLFSDGNRWVDITQVVFLEPNFRQEPQVGDMSFKLLQLLNKGSDVIIDIPAEVYQSFAEYDVAAQFQAKCYDKYRFFRELFFPNIASVPSYLRNDLFLYTLEDKTGRFDDLIKAHACIPATPDGQKLKCPGQLINPYKTAASLFSPDDERFPFDTEGTFLNSLRLAKLEQLGMLTDDLPWPEVAERAQSISMLNRCNSEAALNRVKVLVDHLEKKLKREDGKYISHDVHNSLLEAEFLPVLQKPEKFPLPWKGDEEKIGIGRVLLSPNECFLEREKYLVCCTEPIVDLFIPSIVQQFLHLDKKQATVNHVTAQLNVASSANADSLDSLEFEHLKNVCLTAYRYFQNALYNSIIEDVQVREIFREKKFILSGGKFVSTEQVAFKLDVDCSPYLYLLPHDLARSFNHLMKTVGVREVFEEKDFTSSMKQIKQKFGDTQIDEKTLQVAINVAVQLGNCLTVSEDDVSKIQENRQIFYLPDSQGVMRSVGELCVRDCPWFPDEIGVHFANDMIPPKTSIKLGVKTRREEALQHFSSGIPFGQKEKLTDRLRRILTAYPSEREILKELLQNADDAQATEICFIKDPRQHQGEKVFGDSWKRIQGPALCVYNNKPFTEADIEGIQNLGKGSKGHDPNKTGQYGVGFNAVYHLTDVPSFATSGEEIGDVLCVLDPHHKYVPGATEASPGIMFRETAKLKRMFPDVFSCYIEEEFPIQNSTMFRFPLRTQEMANDSKISKSPVTLTKLDGMMEALKRELFDVLLFVNSVRKITLCDIDAVTGKAVNSYFVETEMSEEDETKRKQFATYVKQIGNAADQIEGFPNNIEVKRCSYVLNLRDNIGNEEKWLIVQQVGFENEVQGSIVDAYTGGELGMLPRGGVACLLEKKLKQEESESSRMKVYCFLPLPLETSLPVHINGHFALDHEARRNLWRDETSGYRSDWNNALLTDVIASCYLTLLDEVRSYLHLPTTRNSEPVTVDCNLDAFHNNIECYEKLFPLTLLDDSYWATLVRSVYQRMDNKGLRFLPVVRSDTQEGTTSKVHVTWLPPTGEGKSKAFFNNLGKSDCFAPQPKRFVDESEEEKRSKEEKIIEQKTSFKEALLQTGFNLLIFSLSVYEVLQNSDVNACCVSSSSVMEFFKTFKKENALCSIGSIPVDVEETPLKNFEGVTLVLKYCKDDVQFLLNLSGLPLLLTQDNRLNEFSSSDPVFLSRHYGILPQCREMFVHDRLRIHIFGEASSLKSPVFKHFGVEDFATNLHRTLPREYFGSDRYVKWCPTQESEPNQNWMLKVWNFLNEETKNDLKKIEPSKQEDRSLREVQEQEIRSIRAILQPLSNWSILPCTETVQMPPSHDKSASVVVAEHFLVPLRLAETVLDFTSHDDVSSRSLVEALRLLNLPEVNCAVLSLDSSYLARKIVGSIKTPESLLRTLEQKMARNPEALEGKLKTSECEIILRYFSDNVKSLQEKDKKILRRLHFYQATHGALVSVDSERVCALPIGIPRKEMEELGLRLHVVFLEGWSRLSPLFEFLGFECVSAVDVYCNFILKNFGTFSTEGRLAHLTYIRDSILAAKSSDESQKQRIVASLRNTAIVTSKDGTLKKAFSYYEPQNEVFSIMLPEDMFPPEPFNTDEWLSFLKLIGLNCEVSQELFTTFARDVAREGATQRTKGTKEKSKVLVKHLFTRDNVVEEGLLHAICDVRFVATDPVKKELQALHPQFGGGGDGQTPFIAFKDSVLEENTKIAWTTASLLPYWADPKKYLYQISAPGWRSVEYCNAILAHLQVRIEPTVDLVTFHCQNISFQLEKENDVEPTVDQRLIRTSVMSEIYSFLQAKAVSSTVAKERLRHTPCVLVEQGGRSVYPKQVVLELYKILEIQPFLYGISAELAKFTTLFKYLGCSPSVTPSHYALVLHMMHERCKSNRLDPNEVGSAFRAVKGLFETLQDTPDAKQDMPTLYLPATYPFSSTPDDTVLPVVLTKATELIFDDAPQYKHRIQDFNLPFVVDLKRANVNFKDNANYKELIMLLPTAIRPKMMSCVVEETFADSENSSEGFDVGTASSLKKQLHSEQFHRGIVRLVRHANQDGGLDESLVATLRSNLQSIEFIGMNKIITHLVHNGKVIRGSELEVPYFLEKVSKSGEDIWKVYVNAVQDTEENTSTITLTLSKVIAKVCNGLLRDTTLYIPEMLRSQPGKICSLLDRMEIRQDDSYDAGKGDVFPLPGSFVPLAEHNLLNPAFEAFTPGEYIGYELDDPSLELQKGDATYIYAVIIKEVPSDNVSLVTKSYKINIGDDKEPKIVEAFKLYKFCRLQEITSSAVVLSDQQGSFYSTTDKQKIFDEISKTLGKAWRLPEDRRRQIIKRLVLQWHPDKNPGNEVFCTELFQHVKKEIERLERGESRRGESWSSKSYDGGSYDAFYGFWGVRAKQYNSQRREYRNSFFRHYGSYGSKTRSWEVPPSFCTTNPQPREARRWFRQAEADLAAADNDIATVKPSYEWACFKCHQAAEKALKAAQYSVDAYKTNVPNLVQNSLTLDDSQLITLSSQLEARVGDSMRMRYPFQVSFPQIPNDVYSREMARTALELATMILDKVRSRVR